MKLKFTFFLLPLIFTGIFYSCYYKYSYRLIEPRDVTPDWENVNPDGEELIQYFDSKYIYVLGIINRENSIILFDKRKPVIIKPDKKLYAFSLENDQLVLEYKDVKYFYLKRKMPATEEEQGNP